MKAVNKVAGGLYSMFVKAETMGGTINEATKTGDEGGSKEEEREEKAKKAKKDKQEKKDKGKRARAEAEAEAEAEDGAAQRKKAKKAKKREATSTAGTSGEQTAAAAAGVGGGGADGFEWRKCIKAELKGAGGKLPVKALRKAVVAAYVRAGGDKEGGKQAFKLRLVAVSGVSTDGGEARLDRSSSS